MCSACCSRQHASTAGLSGKVAATVVTSPDAVVVAPRGLQRLAPRAIVLALIVWWWPSLTDAGDAVNVMLAGDPEIVADSNPIIRRLREGGLNVEVHAEWASWCDASSALRPRMAEIDAEVIVVSFRRAGECGRAAVTDLAAAAAAEDIPLIVLQPGQGISDSEVDAAIVDLDVADQATHANAARLLGDDSLVERMPCQWWDDCEPDGMVAVRDAAGALTDAGLERMARVLVAVVP